MSDSTQKLLVLRVHLHEPRFHGRPEWPPSPARLFQALVAGAGAGRGLTAEASEALRWLEALPPPVIGAPSSRIGQRIRLWVPNNDLDAKEGDPAQVPEIRTGKEVQPRLLQRGVPFLYGWELPEGEDTQTQAERICSIAEGLYQFGRGVDLAWAVGAVLDRDRFRSELDQFAGLIFRPSTQGQRRLSLACPQVGSLDRLDERFEASGTRFQRDEGARASAQVFVQPPTPSFRNVEYGGGSEHRLFVLQPADDMGRMAVWPVERVQELVTAVRDAAAKRLREALPDRSQEVEATIIGKRPGEPALVESEQRVRIVPLPSIGHAHADRGVRRILVELPTQSIVRHDDLVWAFSGLAVGESAVLVPSDEDQMLRHYGVQRPSRSWRSVTPVALPEYSQRRRIDPAKRHEQAKGSPERDEEQERAQRAVATALRHAGIRARVLTVGVQREPFGLHEARAEAFARGTRFAKERLWYVEVEFSSRVSGPLVIGDGRFLGFGVMAPNHKHNRVVAFSIESGLSEDARPEEVAGALRRAVMARCQDALGKGRRLPTVISGHMNGQPAADQDHASYVFDPPRQRLLVLLPTATRRQRELLEHALSGFADLRAGGAGMLRLESEEIDTESDALFAASHVWSTVTPYTVNRHRALDDAAEAIAEDVRASCRSEGLPDPVAVAVTVVQGREGIGLTGHVKLTFAVAVRGPLTLGRTRHKGGGLFEGRK